MPDSTKRRMEFKDIIQLPRSCWETMIEWEDVEFKLSTWSDANRYPLPLNMEPDFQRAHVWTQEQQTVYIEYMLRGGEVGRNIIFNCVGWMSTFSGPFVIIDGKQRLEAVRSFLRDEVKAFGQVYSEFGQKYSGGQFLFRMCNLKSRAAILEMYININSGGTPHTNEEIDRVKELLRIELTK